MENIIQKQIATEGGLVERDDEWTHWHLTPEGWQKGSQKRKAMRDTVEIPMPGDRVMSYTYREYLRPIDEQGIGGWEKLLLNDWCSSDKELVSSLLKRFGYCPRQL
jgi:hypothetical protein